MLKFGRLTASMTAILSLMLALHSSGSSQEHPGCFMVDDNGQLIDLSAICPFPEQSSDEPTLGTGDVQVTLRWSTTDDLDLWVTDPSGKKVYFENPRVASGGELDVDSNAGCSEGRQNPVENVFWPTSRAPSGNYVAEVNLYSRCKPGTEPIEFSLKILVQGNTKELTGKVDDQNGTVRFPFSFPATGEQTPR